jgi:hypothetical protein
MNEIADDPLDELLHKCSDILPLLVIEPGPAGSVLSIDDDGLPCWVKGDEEYYPGCEERADKGMFED